MRTLAFHRVLAVAIVAGSCLSLAGVAVAQPPAPAQEPRNAALAALEPFEGRPIREVKLVGVRPEDEQLVRNQLRIQAGQPLSISGVEGDLQRVNRLGRFKQMTATLRPYDDQSVVLVYSLVETPVVKAVQAVGNRQVSDQELAAEVDILVNTPIDPYRIDRTLRKMRDLYKKKGYYQADITIDQKELDENGVLLFRIREGERLKVTDIRFEGVNHVDSDEIRRGLKTETWGLFYDGVLDEVVLDQDLAEVIRFYKDHGYLDVRADRRITPAPNGREAIVTFVVEEGRLYTLRSVRFEVAGIAGADGEDPRTQPVYTREQIAGLIPLKKGDIYSQDLVRKSVEAVSNAYGKLGYVDVRVVRAELRDPANPVVDLVLSVNEGRRYKTGTVEIVGNEITQQKVIRRQVQVVPDRPLDSTKLRDTGERLVATNLFAGAREQKPPPRATVQAETPDNPGYRDVVVEVAEKNTASVAFGAAVSSDGGLVGSITLDQRNFDITDPPESFDEFIRGRAFRGAGQAFNITVAPGTETQTYTIALGEPYLFETDVGGNISGGLRTRTYDEYTEDKLFTRVDLGRRFGDRWSGSMSARIESVNLRDFDPQASTDALSFKGRNGLSGVGVRMQRTTTDAIVRPTRGSIFRANLEQVGALGGEYFFTTMSAEHQLWLTLHEDVLGRKTVLATRTNIQYIPQNKNDVPVYERIYMGGRNFRGFDYRGVSPYGVYNNPAPPPATLPSPFPIGGTFGFFAGAQVEQPLFSTFVSGVAFIDTGTVDTTPSFSKYRVSVGLGVRIYLPALGQAPLAFDFGFPLLKQDTDQTQLLSFSLDVPF